MIGCDCEVCTSADPRDNRTRSSLYLQTPEMALVVDTGPDLRMQCLREGILALDAVLITHAHMDHIVGFDDLRRFTLGTDAKIDVYARQSVMDDLKRMFAFAFNGENCYPGYLKPVPKVVRGTFPLGKMEVSPLPVQHGKVETIGYLFSYSGRKRLAYIPDCKVLSDEAAELVAGVETLVVDALRFTPHATHMNFEEALALVDDLKPGRVFFTHFADEVMHARDEVRLPPGVKLAYDGLRIGC